MTVEKQQAYIYNSHVHCFTIDHVPNYFARKLIVYYFLFSIRWIKKNKVIRWLVRFLNKKWVVQLLKWVAPHIESSLSRMLTFVQYFDVQSQEEMLRLLQGYYPRGTRFIVLTMDMEYMGAGKPIKDFRQQLDELESIKSQDKFKEVIYPFVFADPRRPEVTSIVKDRLGSGKFNGIKLYPALGYFPFDKRLRDIYHYAIREQLPVITHCIRGVVYYRGSKNRAFDNHTHHPIATHQSLMGKTNHEFTVNFTHPLNYECLLNVMHLKKYWGDDAIDLRELKICLGHFGGEDEWRNYLTNAWLPDKHYPNNPDPDALDIRHPWFDDQANRQFAFSWFSLIIELMRKYPNVYADISYTLNDERTFPLLKLLLTADYYRDISKKILFGTDFYVVSKVGAERELSIRLRGYLGEELFNKIAYENPTEFIFAKTS